MAARSVGQSFKAARSGVQGFKAARSGVQGFKAADHGRMHVGSSEGPRARGVQRGILQGGARGYTWCGGGGGGQGPGARTGC